MKLLDLQFIHYPMAQSKTSFWYASRNRFGYYWYPNTMILSIIDLENLHNKDLKLPPHILAYMKLKYP